MHKRNFIGACLGGLAGMALLAQISASHAMAQAPDPVKAGAGDAGKTVSLMVGQTLEVRLDAQPGTGMTWSLAPGSTNLLKYEGAKSMGASNMPGGHETELLTFTATTAGKGELKLEYARPWHETVPPEKTFSLSVNIGAE